MKHAAVTFPSSSRSSRCGGSVGAADWIRRVQLSLREHLAHFRLTYGNSRTVVLKVRSTVALLPFSFYFYLPLFMLSYF